MSKLADKALIVISAVKRLSKRFDADNLTAFAAQAAFFVFIAFFPYSTFFIN